MFIFYKKKWIEFILYLNQNQKNRKVKGVKYIFGNVVNKIDLKKLDVYYDYIINLSGYVDHSKNKSILKIHYNGCRNLVNNFKKIYQKSLFKLDQVLNMEN